MNRQERSPGGETRSRVAAAEPARGPVRRWIGLCLRIAVAAGILAWLLTFIPISRIGSAFAGLRPGWILASLVILGIERYWAAVRTTVLTRHLGMSLTTWTNLEISLLATFYGFFMPGEVAGGAIRWYRMQQPQGMRAQAAAVITVDKLLSTTMLVLLGLVFWFIERPPIRSLTLEMSIIALLGLLVLGFFLMLNRSVASRVLVPLHWIARRLRMRPVYRSVEKVMEAMSSFRRLPPAATLVLFMVTVARQLAAAGLLYAFALALGIDVSFVTLGWIHAFTAIAMLLPVSISGLGLREGAMVLLLEPYGVPGSDALALSLLVFASHILLALTGGLLEVKNVLVGGRARERVAPAVVDEPR